jgi:hypothetical protein
MSMMTLFVASSCTMDDPSRQATMPPPPKHTGPIYQRRPRPPLSSGKALLMWVLSYLVLGWHTLVDGVLLVATILFLSDSHLPTATPRLTAASASCIGALASTTSSSSRLPLTVYVRKET